MKYIFIISLIALFSCSEETKKTKVNRKESQQKILNSIIEKGQSGDVILKQGYGMISNSIVKLLDEEIPLSHCGILVKDTTQQFYIIHSVSGEVADRDGVQRISLKKFINDVKPKDFYLLRYTGGDESKIVYEAQCLLADKVPFDHKYDLTNDTELYCSEFIYKIFLNTFTEEVFVPTPYSYSKILYFNDILSHEGFETIIN